LASLGCGNPIAVAELHDGERVLDLGSGAGIDVLLSAKRVGPTGRAFGLDMTDEMLALAQRNAAEAGATNVEFLKGPHRGDPAAGGLDRRRDQQLRGEPGRGQAGRVSARSPASCVRWPDRHHDVVADDSLTAEQRAERGTYTGCVAGALTFSEFRTGLEVVGLADVSVTVSHKVADGMYSAIVKATKPAAGRGRKPAAGAAQSSCCYGGGCA